MLIVMEALLDKMQQLYFYTVVGHEMKLIGGTCLSKLVFLGSPPSYHRLDNFMLHC